jgi:hypothetical protein
VLGALPSPESAGSRLPPLRPSWWEVARLASWERFATAWWARRNTDHPSRNSLCSSGPVIARISRLTSATVGGISSGYGCPWRSPL